MKLPIDVIVLDQQAQPRAKMDLMIAIDYAAAIERGDQFPAVIAFGDEHTAYLADGWHRLHASKEAGHTEIEVDLRPGGIREAVLYACGANAAHGLRRTNADKRRAVETLLQDEEWRQWSDHEIGRRAHVDHKTAAAIRQALILSREIPQIDDRQVRRGDQVYTQQTASIGGQTAAANKDYQVTEADVADAHHPAARRAPHPDFADDYVEDVNQDVDAEPAFALTVPQSVSARLAEDGEPRTVSVPVQVSPPVGDTDRSVRVVIEQAPPDTLDAKPSREASLRAMAAGADILKEPPEERAYYYISKARLFLDLDPEVIAQTCADPNFEAADWEHLATLVEKIARAVRARSSQPLRIVR